VRKGILIDGERRDCKNEIVEGIDIKTRGPGGHQTGEGTQP